MVEGDWFWSVRIVCDRGGGVADDGGNFFSGYGERDDEEDDAEDRDAEEGDDEAGDGGGSFLGVQAGFGFGGDLGVETHCFCWYGAD